MHVGLNLIYLVPRETGGMETVARELIPSLAQTRPDARITSFVNLETADEPGPWDGATERVVVPVAARSRLQWVRGEQALLPRMAARAGVDVLHSLGATSPLRGPFRRVVSIYDFNYQLLPETHSALRGRGLRALVALGARRSNRVIACSSSTRDDAVRLLGVDPQDIDLVPLGVGASADVEPTPPSALRKRYHLDDRPLLFTLSDKRPHKNLARLIEALGELPAQQRPMLLIAGYTTPYEAQLRSHIARLRLGGDVRLCSWISDADREGLYAIALGFVFPSLYEGFGLPVLEAMARGVPVACSHAASLAEVAGDAALVFDPHRVDEIANALERLVTQGALRTRLEREGQARAGMFTWERSARLTWQSYERALSAR